MEPRAIIVELKRNRAVFKHLLEGIPLEIRKWKPNPEKWCLLEIVCHLLDEEVEDFRERVRHVLQTPDLPLKPFDQLAWPVERSYLNQDFDGILMKFLEERNASVIWLYSLNNPNWNSKVTHQGLGEVSAKSFLVNWLAHDYHHIRQINSLKYDYLRFKSGDDLTYAGNW